MKRKELLSLIKNYVTNQGTQVGLNLDDVLNGFLQTVPLSIEIPLGESPQLPIVNDPLPIDQEVVDEYCESFLTSVGAPVDLTFSLDTKKNRFTLNAVIPANATIDKDTNYILIVGETVANISGTNYNVSFKISNDPDKQANVYSLSQA